MKPFALWFTGLPCSGKTTLANALGARLSASGRPVRILDGDELRKTVSADLGFSDADRQEQVRRTSVWVLELLQQGVTVIVSLVSPHREARMRAKKLIGDCVEVYVRCPLSLCEARDVKGMYRKARRGEIQQFTGVASVYEEPDFPDITVDTDQADVDTCVAKILDYLSARGMC